MLYTGRIDMMNRKKLLYTMVGVAILAMTAVGCAAEDKDIAGENPITDATPVITATGTYTETEKTEKTSASTTVTQETYSGYAAHQAELDEMYLATIAAGDFTPENPYIIVNPYEIAPQSALIVFTTEEAVSVTTSIQGKTPETTITNTVAEKTTYHEIPLIGLYEGENTVEVTLSSGESYLYAITTQDIPMGYMGEDMMEVLTSEPSRLSEGLYMLKNVDRTLLDVNGDVRGYFTIGFAASGCDEVTEDGHIFVSIDEYTNYSAILELDYMGQVYRELFTNNMNTHHDAYLIDDSTLLLGTSYIDLEEYTATPYDPALEEIFNYAGGSIEVRSYGDLDALHLNTVADGGDGYILVSLRNQHAVAKLSYPELEVQWVLSVSDDVYMGAEDKNLTPIGDDFEWFYSQHHVSFVGENSDGTIDITLFDNGVHRGLDLNAEYPDDELYSRMVRYRIDEENMTVEQIWDYGEELGNEYLAFVHSSTQYIPESNTYLGNFDAHDAIETGGSEVPREACYVIELSEDKEVLLEFALGSACYRTEKLTADVFYSAWEGIGVSEKEWAYFGEDVVPYDDSLYLEQEAVVAQILDISATEEYLDIDGWASVEGMMEQPVTGRKLILTHQTTGDSYVYEISTSRWMLKDTRISEENLAVLTGTLAGFMQKRMNISQLEDGIYDMTMVVEMNGKHYAGQLEQTLSIGA